METKNKYSYPLDKKEIKSIETYSPAHKVFYNKEQNAYYDLTNALDFMCNLNVPIRAALDGEVVFVQEGITLNWDKLEEPTHLSGAEQNGNHVLIKHANNEFSIYSHQKVGSIRVKKGDKVKTGAIIGLTGQTGWSTQPHLHFLVFIYPKAPAPDWLSLKIKWKSEK